MIKYIYLFLGTITLILGAIGVVLPIIPTTPFLMVSCYCYGKGSSKFQTWLINSNIYKKYAKDFIENKSLTLKRKIFLLSFASTMLLFPLIILNIAGKALIILLYIALYYYFIFKIKTVKI